MKRKESVHAIQVPKSVGQGNEAGLAQTEATYYLICITVLDLKKQIRQVESSLRLAPGEALQFIRRDTLDGQILPQGLSVGTSLQLLANRSDVRSSELALA